MEQSACRRAVLQSRKAWTLLSKKEQRQPKERRNEDLRIAELVRRVTKRSYPRLLFQCAEP
ncbi:hypothetical protein H5410_005608 [Solanum commersonii]|uniref:Uncharacterized protein n=1 Tax=Solanum commersonii TaxID=4109 RepID=A0A9J6A6V8_SOLCO|nr:hypothetical protein H5410_005608 [Solanum commersonii]